MDTLVLYAASLSLVAFFAFRARKEYRRGDYSASTRWLLVAIFCGWVPFLAAVTKVLVN